MMPYSSYQHTTEPFSWLSVGLVFVTKSDEPGRDSWWMEGLSHCIGTVTHPLKIEGIFLKERKVICLDSKDGMTLVIDFSYVRSIWVLGKTRNSKKLVTIKD